MLSMRRVPLPGGARARCIARNGLNGAGAAVPVPLKAALLGRWPAAILFLFLRRLLLALAPIAAVSWDDRKVCGACGDPAVGPALWILLVSFSIVSVSGRAQLGNAA